MIDGPFRVRPATAADLDRIVQIESGPQTTRYLGVTGRDFHERALADADQEQLVGQVGAGAPGVGAAAAEVVGFVVLAGLRAGGGRIELRRIVIAHEYRGTGFGRRMFRAALARAYHQHGARQVWLDVKPDNHTAQALYASEDFRPAGTIPDPTEPGGTLLVLAHTLERDRAAGRASQAPPRYPADMSPTHAAHG